MDELCRLHSPVDVAQRLGDQPRANYLRRRFVAFVLVLCAGVWTNVAGKAYVDAIPGNAMRATQRVITAKSDLSGTLAGLRIVGVAPNGAAAKSGLKYGDVLIAYNRRPITTEEEIEAVMRFFGRQQDQTKKPATAELSFYRDGDMTVKTIRVPMGRLGIYTREWTLAGALVEDAILHRNDYASAQKYAAEAATSGNYTDDQILHMLMLCLNNEKEGDKTRQIEVDELYRKYLPEKLQLFANYDLVYNKRYRAGAAIFDRYLKIKRGDVSTELSLASCYVEIEEYDEADALLAKILTRSKGDENAPTEYGLSALSIIRAKIYMGRRQYGRAQERFQAAFEHYPDDPYYALGFLYCAARLDIDGLKAGQFEAAYRMVSAQSPETEELMGYHIDALRAFVLVKRRRISAARTIADKWRNSAAARRYIPIFWRRFPDGAEIIDTWNLLLDQQPVAINATSTCQETSTDYTDSSSRQ